MKQCDFNIAEYNIPGYTLFVDDKIKWGVAIYAHVSLNAKLFNTLNDSGFEESVCCQFSALNSKGFIGMYLQKSQYNWTQWENYI